MPYLNDTGLAYFWKKCKEKFAPKSHTHSMGNVSGLEDALAGKAASSHTHSMGNVSGLEAALAGKAASGHTHAKEVYEVSRQVLSIPATGWTQSAQGWQEITVTCAGTVAGSSTQRVDVAVQGTQIGNVLLAGAKVGTSGKLTLVCLAVPGAAFDLMAVISEVRA